MKQKQQTKNKQFGSTHARSDQWTMDMQNRLKSTLEGKISRIETFIESSNEETNSVEVKVKLRTLIQLHKMWRNSAKIEKLDRESRRNFELSHKSKTVPTFQEFIEFLEEREYVLMLVSVDRNAKVNPNKMYANNSKPKAFIVNENKSKNCIVSTIRHHIDKYKREFPHTVELLDRNFYVDDLISGGNEFEEALQTSRRAKNIMEAAGMDLRNWITNDADLMEQWKKENFNVHPIHETVSLGANGTKVLGLSWNTNDDYLTTDTKSLLKFVFLDKNTKRFILQAVGKTFDTLGLISSFTVRMKCFLQDLWKEEIQWDDPLPTHIEKEWKIWSIYLRTKSRNGISVKLVTSKSRVAPLNSVTLPRLELLGALVAARLAFKPNRSPLMVPLCSLPLSLSGKENPENFLYRGLSADCLVSNSRWWTGAEFLSDSEFPKNFQLVVPELDYLTEHEKETVVQERKKIALS
ncbi:DUF1758 domain-containing protein [Trichonephila clavipes]|nr:DUF1758 domain-containing protein [Trichonephila clavipes]